jgi:transcriptional regulator with XRE-family HTH domain
VTTKVEKFWTWFESEKSARGFTSIRAVERAGEVGNATISARASQLLPPTATTLRAIARAFNLPFDFVAKQAESVVTEPLSTENHKRSEVDYLFTQLSSEDQDALLAQIRAYVRERRAQHETGTQSS